MWFLIVVAVIVAIIYLSHHYQGPDSFGRVGHNGVPDQPQVYRDPSWVSPNRPQVYRDPNSVSLCPPHFRMTERDGCQAVR
jgi:hypothetical protein